MIDYRSYYQAIIVSGDGDFACLVRHLQQRRKLGQVIVPNEKRYSDLLDEAAPGLITSLTPLKKKTLIQISQPQEKQRTRYTRRGVLYVVCMFFDQ
ncbi:MAG: NYN domain-containing protein [Candidatus Peribacteria bacterium]|nr:MAG: NYN domain-containing protein [Candidatus Peribacteria bacterium]